MLARDLVVSSSLVPSPSEMVASGSITPYSNAATPGALIDKLAWPVVCVGLFGSLVQAIGLTFPKVFLIALDN